MGFQDGDVGTEAWIRWLVSGVDFKRCQLGTVGQVEEFLGGCQVCGDGHVALLGFGDLKELASQRVGMVAGASAVCQLRLGRHGGAETLAATS